MALYKLENKQPVLGEGVWVAESAEVIGDVVLGSRSSVWFGVVIRGDNEQVQIGSKTNIQESAVLHSDPGSPLTIGDGVTVGHQAMLHGCSVGDGSLIGIQAVVLNGAVIGKHCLVGAGAVVTERKTFPDRSLIVGSPAQVKRELTDAEVANLGASATGYAARGELYSTRLVRIDP